MSLNSGPSSTVNHLYNESNFTSITNTSNESHERPSIFPNIQPGISELVIRQPDFIGNLPMGVSNVFTPPPFSPMIAQPDRLPWKCPQWMSNGTHTGLMQFNSVHRPFKRKSSDNTNAFVRSKQLITEERMTAHLNSLHLSSDYTSHSNVNSAEQLSTDRLEEVDDLRIETKDLEEKLRRAQRITVCEEVRKLREQPILPQAILERYEKPCTALVLWQPPHRISERVPATNQQKDNDSDEEDRMDSNPSGMNTEASMDLDL